MKEITVVRYTYNVKSTINSWNKWMMGIFIVLIIAVLISHNAMDKLLFIVLLIFVYIDDMLYHHNKVVTKEIRK